MKYFTPFLLTLVLLVGCSTYSPGMPPVSPRGINMGDVVTTPSGSSFNPASPGPIGGTTSSTGQFTSVCTGTSPCTLPAAGQINVGSVPLVLSSSGSAITGTNYGLNANTGSGTLELNDVVGGGGILLESAGSAKLTVAGAGVQFPSDNSVNSMARMPITFDTGAIAAVTLGTNFGVYKVVKALTLENYEGLDYSNTGCSTGAVVRVYDCGASAPANAACSGGTQLATVTLSTTAGTVVDGTINSANVAAGEYIGAQIQAAGGCTAIDLDITLMARPQ